MILRGSLFSEERRQSALLWFSIRTVWRSWRNSPSAVMSLMLTIWLSSFFFFFWLYCLCSICCTASSFLPIHSLPRSFVCAAMCWFITCPLGLHKRNLIWPKQCQILRWHAPTVNLLDQINYETSNISHWLSIPPAKYLSDRIFSAVCLNLPKSKPHSMSLDTICLLCTKTHSCGVSVR